jgi:hypothetical protein
MTILADLITASKQAAAAPTKASPRRKLTLAEANDVRKLHARGVSINALATQYELNPAGIRGIIDGRYYTTPDRAPYAPITRRVTWTHADTLPDADLEVIVATKEGEVLPAWWDGEAWRDLTAMPLGEHQVTHWCHYPQHPQEA